MRDPERFDGLGDRLEAADAERAAKRDHRGRSNRDPGERDRVGVEQGDPDADDPVPSSPAFSFDETTAKSIYVRPDTLQRVEDVEALVDAKLRTEHEVRDLTTREFYDAVLHLAIRDPDAVIDRVIELRRE